MDPTLQFMKKKKRIAKISLKNGERKSRKKPESENLVKKPESENLVKKLQSTILPGIVDLVLFDKLSDSWLGFVKRHSNKGKAFSTVLILKDNHVRNF